MRIKPIPSAIAVVSLAFALGLSMPAAAQQDTAALTERLFTAVRANDIATVRLVLTNGADPMALDANGQTPAGIAIDRGYFEIAHHILGVRNQRQAFTRRDSADELNARPGTRTVATSASAPGEERRPEPSWRQNTAPGQATEIPSPRLSSPREASVLTPSVMISGPTRAAAAQAAAPAAAAPKGAQKGPASGPVAAVPAPATQPTLANLPVLPAGAPNPFDPKSPEPAALPVLTSTTPAVRPEATANAEKSRETSSGNVLGRFFNGISGVFGGGGS